MKIRIDIDKENKENKGQIEKAKKVEKSEKAANSKEQKKVAKAEKAEKARNQREERKEAKAKQKKTTAEIAKERIIADRECLMKEIEKRNPAIIATISKEVRPMKPIASMFQTQVTQISSKSSMMNLFESQIGK